MQSMVRLDIFGDRIKGLKLRRFGAYFGYKQGAALNETSTLDYCGTSSTAAIYVTGGRFDRTGPHIQGAAVDEVATVDDLVYFGTPSTAAPAVDELRKPKLAIVGKIQLANVPQFESFYSVPNICSFLNQKRCLLCSSCYKYTFKTFFRK